MKHPIPALLLLPFPLLAAGCRAEADAPEGAAPAAGTHEMPLPASALVGAVRALETLDAVRPPGTITQLRALECDRLTDPNGRGEIVRVFLHVTVYAGTAPGARAAFEELKAALEHEAHERERASTVLPGRVERVLAGLDWDPAGREDLVSYSDAIRLEVLPGHTTPGLFEGVEPAGAEAHSTLESYVRDLAEQEHVGPVALALARDPRAAAQGANEIRCRIEEGTKEARHTRAEIGAFLAALEGDSPAARVTQLKIERSEEEFDVHAPGGWRFEAELSVRASPPGSAAAAAQAAAASSH